ncbi:MAG: TRAP transporter substrate-binding protein DctP [Thermodesulfobacteriota bacterium]|nr:TRAP transporter substrate-binding protein DctP [Thermodesulfobacteriota bacterium]
MKLKRCILVPFLLVGVLFLSVEFSIGEPSKKKIVLKMATHAPKGISYALYVKDNIDPALEKATNGEVVFDWYHGGIMGDDEDWMAKIEIDQLQGAGIDGHGTKMFGPGLAVLDLPFLFNNAQEVGYVRENLWSSMVRIFEDNGYKLLVLIDQGNEGFDEIYSLKRPIRTPEDFAKTRFVTYSGVVEAEILKALGASPIPLNVPEIVSSMRAGICNGLIAPAIWYVGSQLYTITKYVTPVRLRYAPGGLVISMKAWNRIPEKYHKEIVQMLLAEQDGANRFGWDSSKRCYKAMINYGLEEVKLTPSEIDVLKKQTRPIWDRLAGKEYTREMLDEILEYLDEYRSLKDVR